jgi:hypothetical protein
MDMRFETWNVKSLSRSHLLKAVASELAKCKLDLMAAQEVSWDKCGSESADCYAFFYGNGNDNRKLGTGFFIHTGIRSAAKRVEFVNVYNTKRPLV